MSPHQHYAIARARQQEIVSRALNSHRSDTARTITVRQRGLKHRIAQLVAVLGVCVAAGTAVTVGEAHSNHRPVKQPARHVSPQQLSREIQALEAKGYVPTSCTVNGTLMHNYSTDQSVTVEW